MRYRALLFVILVPTLAWGRPFEGLSRRDQLALLYRPQYQFTRGGEPLVSVGLHWGIREMNFSGPEGLRLLPAGQDGVELPVTAGRRVTVRVASAKRAVIRYWPTQRIKGGDARRAAKAIAAWRSRGFEPRLFELGGVLGLKGKVLDTRVTAIGVRPFSSREKALHAADSLRRRFAVPLAVHLDLHRPARGVLEVVDEAGTVRARVQDLVWIVPARGDSVRVGGRRYRGTVYATFSPEGKLAVGNSLPLEQVLLGVVPSEIYPTGPIEALKAQAVTARGEVLAKIGSRHFEHPFQICSRQHCQVYSGRDREHPRTSRAVRSTRGRVLLRRGALVDAVYSASCGGHTEHNNVVWGSSANPTLRGRPDGIAPPGDLSSERTLRGFLRRRPASYCARARLGRASRFRWRRRFTQAELSELVSRRKDLGRVERIRVLGRGVSGRVRAIEVEGEYGKLRIDREYPVRKLFGGLFSGMFVVDPIEGPGRYPSAFTFRGGGWGHGVGMCQTGAMGMAEAGRSYRQVLRYYYRGSRVRRVY